MHPSNPIRQQSANALRWQVWTALLVCALLRCQGFLSCTEGGRFVLLRAGAPAGDRVFAGIPTPGRGTATVPQPPADRRMN